MDIKKGIIFSLIEIGEVIYSKCFEIAELD